RANYAEVSSRDDAPLAEALGLILRERVAGVAIPPSGNAIVELWRREIDQKAGGSLADLLSKFEDQDLFSRASRQLLRDLNLVPDSELDADSDEAEGGDDQEPEAGTDESKPPEQGMGESEDTQAEEDQAPGESEDTG